MATMLSSLAILAATLAPAASGDEALSGRDGNYAMEWASVEGTVWKGELGTAGIWIIRFERGGVVSYSLPPFHERDMSWNQQGNVVVMKANNGNSEFRLVIDGKRLRGEGHNKDGEHWKMDMKHVGPIKRIAE